MVGKEIIFSTINKNTMNSATLQNTLSVGELKRLQIHDIPPETNLSELTWKQLNDIFYILDDIIQSIKVIEGCVAASDVIEILSLRAMKNNNAIF